MGGVTGGDVEAHSENYVTPVFLDREAQTTVSPFKPSTTTCHMQACS